MKIAILGYGQEGPSAEKFLRARHPEATFDIFDSFSREDLKLSDYDLVVRSPSVPPTWLKSAGAKKSTTVTRLFFSAIKNSVIGITGTKGKGTTSSLIATLLEATNTPVKLVGNIGTPALDSLDQIQPQDVIIYEMSSFQLWDLDTSPHIAVVLGIAPDHLDRHTDFDDYVAAKGHIAEFQSTHDYCIYDSNNQYSAKIAALSPGHKIPYPPQLDAAAQQMLDNLLGYLTVPGNHNREDATIALMACAAHYQQDLSTFIQKNHQIIANAFTKFQGLPHRIEFVRELNNIRYYDDNYSSAFPALDVALATFADTPTILIAGGKDRGLDLSTTKARLFSAPNLKKVILIGETAPILAADADPNTYIIADSLESAVKLAKTTAEQFQEAESSNYDLCIPGRASVKIKSPVVVMSPGAASFDMFKNFRDRGEQFQQLVRELE